MDYDKLIEDMREIAGKNSISLYKRGRCADAATAIETLVSDLRCLQTERDTLLAANQHLLADREQLTAERDAAVADMEALMWFSGEGCRICAHAVEVHKEPYVRLECDREKGTDCSPKWRGIKEG